MKKRTNTAFWVEKEKRWCIAVQKNGTRKRFYSSTPGRTGQREANAKADAWLDDSIRDGRKKVATLYAEWVEELKLTCGTSYVEQCKKYGDYYILPVCGDIRIDELTEGDLQKAINMSFKKRCLKKERQRRSSDKPLSRKTIMTIRSTEISFLKWCRRNRYSTMFPELSIPKNARMGKKKILQPTALKVLFDVDTRLYYGKLVFDEYIYAYRFAVATGVRPGELVGLWYGDIKGNTVNLRRSILQLSMTPDLCDEHFAGNSSGVALQYKLWGIEQVRAAKERTFTDGLRALLAVLTKGERLLGRSVDLTGGEVTFYKNLPQDNAALAETLLSLSPLLSRQTILENLPWVADAQEELRRRAAENG